MNNYYGTYQPNYVPQYQQLQQIFPQSQGNVYSINTPAEIGSVPISSTGLSVVLCLTEDIMYIKSFQGGAPVITAYKVAPYQKSSDDPDKEKLIERITNLETKLSQMDHQNGGTSNANISTVF